MLTLPIKKKWFDMIRSGEKKEEYREITPYYMTRFENIGLIHKNAPFIKVIVRLFMREGKPEWGAEPNKTYYVLQILKVYDFTQYIKDGDGE